MSTNKEIDKDCLLNSLASMTSVTSCCKNFDNFIKNKGKDYVDFICYDYSGKGVRDLFYQQGVVIKDNIYINDSIIANSNFPRNIFTLLKKNPSSKMNLDGKNDLFVKAIEDNLIKLNYKTKNGLKVNNITDIDIIFQTEKTIYIAECKNVFSPTDMFELRTTLDALKKAEEQLEKIRISLKKPSIQQKIILNNGFDDKKPIEYFIITSNRILSNNNIFKFPIRTIFEFLNYIKTGNLLINNCPILLWKNAVICDEDIKNFLSTNYITNIIFNQWKVVKLIVAGYKKGCPILNNLVR